MRVVIIGAGFGGLRVAKELAKTDIEVVLIDRNNYHRFQPLLYQVATTGLDPEDIIHPVRNIFSKAKNVRFMLGQVEEIDRARRQLRLHDDTVVSYDYLVLAGGATTNYFGVDGAEEYGHTLKDIPSAMALRNHILHQFEAAERNPDRLEEGDLTFVIVGGGPTGVEMAGQMAEVFKYVLREDYRAVDSTKAKVILVEMLPDLLMPFDDSLRAYTRRALERRGVEVRTNTMVERITADGVYLEDGEHIPAKTLIWAAGVKAGPLAGIVGTEQTKSGRLVVNPELCLPENPEIFAVGDIAGGMDEAGNPYPQLATVAIQQGRHVGEQLRRIARGEPAQPFTYRDPGIMATIGRNDAVAQLAGGLRLRGIPAWLMWALVHVYKLVGFRNRIDVFLNWVYNYATYNFSARIILEGAPERHAASPTVEL